MVTDVKNVVAELNTAHCVRVCVWLEPASNLNQKSSKWQKTSCEWIKSYVIWPTKWIHNSFVICERSKSQKKIHLIIFYDRVFFFNCVDLNKKKTNTRIDHVVYFERCLIPMLQTRKWNGSYSIRLVELRAGAKVVFRVLFNTLIKKKKKKCARVNVDEQTGR